MPKKTTFSNFRAVFRPLADFSGPKHVAHRDPREKLSRKIDFPEKILHRKKTSSKKKNLESRFLDRADGGGSKKVVIFGQKSNLRVEKRDLVPKKWIFCEFWQT